MPFSKFSRNYFGSNYGKAERNYTNGIAVERSKFQKKYPSADISKFEFDADLTKTGDLIRTFTRYRNEAGELFEITGYLFEKNYENLLYWTPRIWDVTGTYQPFALASDSLSYNVRKFTIYVNGRSGFTSNFEALKTSWKGTANDITKVPIDKDDPYFASLLAALIISHVGGISRKHLNGNNKFITSIARYYIYYHMKRFTENPTKMSPYITDDLREIIKNNLQTKTTWTDKFEYTRANISYWYAHHKNKHNIRNYRYRMSKNHTGVLGTDYQEVSKIENNNDTDWIRFIKEDSDGLTKIGQKLFQLAIESYIYCVLDAQAQTRWPIVGQGAKSLQTQDIFHRLVKDTITQDNPTKAISDMRTAIKDTNVVLNMAITPGIILIPSNMIILKEKVAGYNNVLTLATKEMKFGVNENVNYVKPVQQEKVTKVQQQEGKVTKVPVQLTENNIPATTVFPKVDKTTYLLGSMATVGFLIAKYVL